MSEEIKALIVKQAEAFDAFKKANDARLAEMEKKGVADVVLVEKVEKLNTLIGEQQKTIDALNAKAGRKQVTEEEEQRAAHTKAFLQFVRKGKTEALDELNVKAVTVGTDADGGYAVPDHLETNIIKLETAYSPMREVCSQRTVSSDRLEILTDLGGATSGWVAETAARPETASPTLTPIIVPFGEIYAMPKASQRSLEDLMFDVEAWLADAVAREFAEEENLAFLTGNGTNKPKGILGHTLSTSADGSRTFGQIQKIHSATSASIGATSAVAGDKLLDLVHALKRGYRNGAIWMMGNLTFAAYRKIKDDVNGYLWEPGLTAGAPSTLFGYPVVENDDMAEVGTADANAVIFGNFKRGYLIADRRGIATLRDPYSAKPYVLFYSTKRVGGDVIDDRAFKVLALSA